MSDVEFCKCGPPCAGPPEAVDKRICAFCKRGFPQCTNECVEETGHARNCLNFFWECMNCKGRSPQYHNSCSWDCCINLAKKEGGKVHTPNGLPIRSIRADNEMFEHEHGDHPDYKFLVEVEFIGERPADLPEWDDSYRNETHALIYTDGHIALTLYEHNYAMWGWDGTLLLGNYWKKGEWRLTDESITKIGALRK